MAKYCKECGKLNQNPLHKLCFKCSGGFSSISKKSTRLKQTALKQQSQRKIQRKQIEGKETDVFLEVFEIQKGKCLLTGRPVINPGVECYPHILNKGTYPKLRLQNNNIVLVQSGYHDKLDEVIDSLKKELGSKYLEKTISERKDIRDIIKRHYIVMLKNMSN